MKRVALLRHAKSSWDDERLDDFDRPLNDRGWKAARRLGRELKQRGISFDLCLSSPSARTRETLDGVAEGYGALPFAIRFEPRIYEATAQTLLELVRGLPDDTRAALLVGHNPGMERLVAELAGDDGRGTRDKIVHKFPTCGLALLELPAGSWPEVQPASGRIVELILPKELD